MAYGGRTLCRSVCRSVVVVVLVVVKLCPARKVSLEPTQGGACDAKARFKALQEDVIVDGVECRRQVQKDQNGEIAAVDRQQNV